MAKRAPKYVRQMPKIYGDLQRPKRSFSGVFRWVRNLAWLLAVAAFAYAFWFSGWFSAHSVDVQGTAFSSADDIRRLVPLGTNIWFISKDKLSRQIVAQPGVDSVSILRGIPDSVRIVVREKQPALLWTSGPTAYVVDDEGYSFASYPKDGLPAADTAVGKLIAPLPRIVDSKGVAVEPERQIASPLFIQFIQSVQKEMAAGLPQLSVDHMEVADTTYDVTLLTKEGMKVRLNSLGDAPSQVRNLSRLITQEKLNTKTASVDLRVDRWAYVVP